MTLRKCKRYWNEILKFTKKLLWLDLYHNAIHTKTSNPKKQFQQQHWRRRWYLPNSRFQANRIVNLHSRTYMHTFLIELPVKNTRIQDSLKLVKLDLDKNRSECFQIALAPIVHFPNVYSSIKQTIKRKRKIGHLSCVEYINHLQCGYPLVLYSVWYWS